MAIFECIFTYRGRVVKMLWFYLKVEYKNYKRMENDDYNNSGDIDDGEDDDIENEMSGYDEPSEPEDSE